LFFSPQRPFWGARLRRFAAPAQSRRPAVE